MIQHLYFGIQLAIDSGGRLIPIVDGAAYCGFVLKGDNLVVAVRNKIVKALEPEELQAQLRLLNTHQEAVEKIHQVVVELEKLRDLEDPSIESCTRNPRALRAMIQNRLATTLEPKKEKILELIQKLSYSQTFWDITSPNILRFLTLMDRKEDIFEEPMYIHGDVFFARASNILEYISVFGSQGPSIYEGTAAKQVCKPEDVDPNLHIIDGKRAVPHVPYKKTGIIQAAAGWATASKNHSFRYTPAKGKGMVTGFSDNKKRDGVIANPHFEAFYSSLRHWMYSSQTENLKQGKGKRKADTMEVDREDRAEGSSKKRITWF